MKVEEIKKKLLNVMDPSSNESLGEVDAIKHVGIDDNNTVILIVEVADKATEYTKQIQRDIAKIVKLDLGFAGVKIEFQKRKTRNKNAKTLLIASGKGGVGKSTVTANLAYALMRMGKKVAIIDADIYGANMPKILGGVGHQLLADADNKVFPFEVDGIQMVSTEYLVEKNRALMLRGPMLGKILKIFFEDTLWNEEIDYFLVDLPPGTGDVMMDIKNFSEDAKMVLVTTPQESAAHIAIKAGYAAKDLSQDLLGVVENMSYYEVNGEDHFIFGKGGGQKVADELMVELLEKLPIVPSDKPIYKESDVAGMIYLNLARKIMKLY
ncbi:MAG: P-loop NTPase [Candidatus Izemoplasmatales bacterium]|uniref:Iron-sulfur cluster carrier protein n=1 Tax=Hujiaoplasma nucleasis TaxID=2725268 RepID=A0A7L6N1S2_9MOLU|nr:P-loop NTPase [Hujiaoplasma nucleasis]QLY39382.1 P-loop NTPase [Hujiaoplasma nucleasis]